MKNKKSILIIYYLILLIISLVIFSGKLTETQAAEINGSCYQVFLPMVIGSGGGQPAPPVADPCNAVGGNSFADFNGDGYADLAIGVPYESVMFNGADVDMAGAVNVIYGSPSGLTSTNNQLWHRAVPGILFDPEDQDLFGYALTAGDFNSDGFDDLAIGVINSTAGQPLQDQAGVVQIIYGSINGLTAAGNEVIEQGSNGLSDTPDYIDAFGASLESGDYDGDGHDDLAIGVVGEDVQARDKAGAVHIVYGGEGGFRYGDNFITQNTNGSPGEPWDDEFFGYDMASGDFNNDGFTDLAVGVPKELVIGNPTYDKAGAVQIFYGASFGLVDITNYSVNSEIWHSDSNDYVYGDLVDNNEFGTSVAAADFDGDGYDDLAVGIPYADYGAGAPESFNSGAINVFYGSFFGIDATQQRPALLWHQASLYMGDDPEQGDHFGFALTAADFNNDGYPDLAIGIPYERNFLFLKTGAVSIMYSSEDGLSGASSSLTFNSISEADCCDNFGRRLTAGDYNADGFIDLAIGSPYDKIENGTNSGTVIIRYSDNGGVPGPIGQETWHQDSPGILDTAENDDQFSEGLR